MLMLETNVLNLRTFSAYLNLIGGNFSQFFILLGWGAGRFTASVNSSQRNMPTATTYSCVVRVKNIYVLKYNKKKTLLRSCLRMNC